MPRYSLVVLSVPFLLVAAELNFSASVDRNRVGLGEQVQLTVTVSGTNIGSVPRPELPSLPDFDNLGSTSSQSTSISFVNGRMTQEQTISFVYFLSPKRTGELTIGPCRLDFKGTTYQTEPIGITVTKESQMPAPSRQPPTRPSPFDWDPFGRPEPRRSGGRGAVQLGASADRTSVFQGEQVTVSFTFYTQAQVTNLNMKEMPSFTGFWVEKLFDAKELSYRRTTYNGQQYNAATLKRVALFPTQSGELKIGKMTVAGERIVSGGFFFDSAEPFEVSSEPITVQVKPLPEQGRPADFSGGVGDFRLSAALSKDSSVGGEPITLVIKVTGTGNIGLVGEPKLAPIPGVKVLAPESKLSTSTQDSRISGTRTFNYPLIPTADGRYSVPSISMSFFNPKSGTYYTLTTPSLEFCATGATSSAVLSEAELGVRTLGTDIAHIKSTPADRIPGFSRWHWLFYPLGSVVLAVGLVAGRHRRRLEQDRGYARRTRSSRLVRRRLAEAETCIKQNRIREFYAALQKAVLGYAGDRFNIEVTGMTNDSIRAELIRKGVAAEVVDELLNLAAQCDTARFSPGLADCQPNEILARARRILENL
ncbi:MAG: BatD family protein [candidate division WOR-3 bacterium]